MCGLSTVVTPAGASLQTYREIYFYANSIWDDNNNKIPGSGFIFVASEYPSMTNKEIIQYTNVLFTQAPIRVCLHGTNIDSRTILVTMYYCG